MEHGFEIEIDLAPGGADTSSVPAHLVAIAGYPGASQSPSPWRLRAASLQRPRRSPSRPAALSSAGPSLIAIDSHAPGRGNPCVGRLRPTRGPGLPFRSEDSRPIPGLPTPTMTKPAEGNGPSAGACAAARRPSPPGRLQRPGTY